MILNNMFIKGFGVFQTLYFLQKIKYHNMVLIDNSVSEGTANAGKKKEQKK